MTGAIPDRTGQVWEWHGRLILIIAPPDPHARHCDARVDEHMHPVLYLEDLGHVDGVFERPDHPWEEWNSGVRRVA